MIISLFISIVVLEIILVLLVNNFKKKFQWLLTRKDEFPFKDQKELKNFIKSKYSKNLGWKYKEGSSGIEFTNQKKTTYKISKQGFRKDLNNFKHSKISVFGDSFAFCRYVNDSSTWQSFLSQKIKTNIRNFGVGNYGLDQSFLRLKNLKLNHQTKIIIFNFVPHTMERVFSYWRHYSEFGNIYGFKPLFILKKNKLFLKENVLKKNTNLKDIKKKINILKKFDLFYKIRFSKRIFKFPYIITYFKDFKLYTKVLMWLSMDSIIKIFHLNSKKYLIKAQKEIVKKNIYEINIMYKNEKYTNLIKKLIYEIKKFSIRKKKKIIFLITPTIIDINLFQKNIRYQVNFFSKIKDIDLINLTEDFSKKKLGDFFIDDKYAGHLSAKGNKFVAIKLLKFLKTKEYLR